MTPPPTQLETRLAQTLDAAARRGTDPLPHWRDLQHRAQRRHRRRVLARTAVLVVVVAAGAGVATTLGGSGTTGHVAAPARAPRESASQQRPVLNNCTPTSARVSTVAGSPQTAPPQDAEVFAVPVQGVAGPLAILLRSRPAQSAEGTVRVPNTTIDGQPATIDPITQGHGGATWRLPDGEDGLLYTADLDASQVLALAQAISTADPTLPAGLISVGSATTSTQAIVTQSQCSTPQGIAAVAAVTGPIANRYANVITAPAGLRWDQSSITYFAYGTPGLAPTSVTPSPIHQASVREWDALLAATPEPGNPTGFVVNACTLLGSLNAEPRQLLNDPAIVSLQTAIANAKHLTSGHKQRLQTVIAALQTNGDLRPATQLCEQLGLLTQAGNALTSDFEAGITDVQRYLGQPTRG